MAKLYGPARAVSDIDSLQIGKSSRPAISAVNKATFISKINSTKAVRDKIVAGDNITGASFEIAQSGSNWNGYVAINFGDIIVKSSVTGVSVSDAVALLESWGGTVITPESRNLYSPLTLTDITYGDGTRQIGKLYGPVLTLTHQLVIDSATVQSAPSDITVTNINYSALASGIEGLYETTQQQLDYSEVPDWTRIVFDRHDSTIAVQIYIGSTEVFSSTTAYSLTPLSYFGIAHTGTFPLYGVLELNLTAHDNSTNENRTKQITKLYASVNGVTKRIF